MGWNVEFKKKIDKKRRQLPQAVQVLILQLIADIQELGPIRGDWPNYSKLSDGSHHCHLNYYYVAVWVVANNKVKIVEIIYVGSRENAPY